MTALRPRGLRGAGSRHRTRNTRAARAQVVAGDVGAGGRGRHRSGEPRSSHATGTRSTGPRLSTRIDLEDVHGRGAPSPGGARRDRPAGAGGDVPHGLAARLARRTREPAPRPHVRCSRFLVRSGGRQARRRPDGAGDRPGTRDGARAVAVRARIALQLQQHGLPRGGAHRRARSRPCRTTCTWRASSSRRWA